jgi:acetolactate synthase-1/2/3 large subunit
MQRADGSLVSKPLEDLWPFLPRDEFYANMIVPPLED